MRCLHRSFNKDLLNRVYGRSPKLADATDELARFVASIRAPKGLSDDQSQLFYTSIEKKQSEFAQQAQDYRDRCAKTAQQHSVLSPSSLACKGRAGGNANVRFPIQTRYSTRQLERLLQDSPDDTSLLVQLAASYAANGEIGTGELLVRVAIESRPEGGAAQYLLGQILWAQGERGAAVDAFKTAANLGHGDAHEALNPTANVTPTMCKHLKSASSTSPRFLGRIIGDAVQLAEVPFTNMVKATSTRLYFGIEIESHGGTHANLFPAYRIGARGISCATDGQGDPVDQPCSADLDADGDGLDDCAEADLGTDPASSDSDGDGFSDSEEVACVSNPLTLTSVLPPAAGKHNDPGTLVSNGKEVGDVIKNISLVDQRGEMVDIWDFYGEYHVLYMTSAG